MSIKQAATFGMRGKHDVRRAGKGPKCHGTGRYKASASPRSIGPRDQASHCDQAKPSAWPPAMLLPESALPFLCPSSPLSTPVSSLPVAGPLANFPASSAMAVYGLWRFGAEPTDKQRACQDLGTNQLIAQKSSSQTAGGGLMTAPRRIEQARRGEFHHKKYWHVV